jgi:hypothetical protein
MLIFRKKSRINSHQPEQGEFCKKPKKIIFHLPTDERESYLNLHLVYRTHHAFMIKYPNGVTKLLPINRYTKIEVIDGKWKKL